MEVGQTLPAARGLRSFPRNEAGGPKVRGAPKSISETGSQRPENGSSESNGSTGLWVIRMDRSVSGKMGCVEIHGGV